MENLDELKREIFNWAAERGQEHVAIEITRMWFRMCMSNFVGIERHDDMPVHRKFFALLNLGFDYWQPSGGAISPADKKLVHRLITRNWATSTQRAQQWKSTVRQSRFPRVLFWRWESRTQNPEQLRTSKQRQPPRWRGRLKPQCVIWRAPDRLPVMLQKPLSVLATDCPLFLRKPWNADGLRAFPATSRCMPTVTCCAQLTTS